MLSLEAIKSKGNGFADFYIDVIDAVLGYKSTVACSNSDYATAITTVLYYEFPLYGVTFECEYGGAGSTEVKFKYLVSREEQEKTAEKLFECIIRIYPFNGILLHPNRKLRTEKGIGDISIRQFRHICV